ncbi:MAG: prepilin-type N-terminal cleavage/methylation domain-containing protein [Patescibacteria group bacterium]|jgi:prepilin-type N-terminal cleavage/methylation domain-containing protein
MELKKNSGFTLLEILIVVSLLAIIAAAIIVFLNPMLQINKAQDSRKKSDLNVLKKSFEDYYNDKNCYPTLEKVCYNAKSQYAPNEAKTCNICGSNPLSPSFTPYMTALPCDPESPKKEFLYQVDDLTCPKWFKVYSELGYKIDPIISELGCSSESCGPKPDYGFDFAVTSPNTEPEKPSVFYCFNDGKNCNSCGASYELCLTVLSCKVYKKYYPNLSKCCEDNTCATIYHCITTDGGCRQCSIPSECIVSGQCKEKSPGKYDILSGACQ